MLVGGNLGEIGFTAIAALFSRTAPLDPPAVPAGQPLHRPRTCGRDRGASTRGRLDRRRCCARGPDASLGHALRRDVAIRGTATALGATGAWAAARLTGDAHRGRRRSAWSRSLAPNSARRSPPGGWRQPATLLTGGRVRRRAGRGDPDPRRQPASSAAARWARSGWTQAVTAASVATVGSQVASRVVARRDAAAERRRTPDADAVTAIGSSSHGPARHRRHRLRRWPLVPRLLAEGHRVRCLVRDPRGCTAPWRDRVQVVTGRVEDEGACCVPPTARRRLLPRARHGGALSRPGRARIAAAAAFRDGRHRWRRRTHRLPRRTRRRGRLARASPHLYARHQAGADPA